MEKEEQAIHTCAVHKSAICQGTTCERSEYDPRSYCHSICAKPHHVCKKTTCKKFLKINRQGEENVVCASIRTCHLTRRFGPQEEDDDALIVKDNWQDSVDDISNSQGAKQVNEEPEKKVDIEAANPDKISRKLLKELALHLDEDKIGNIIALGKNEICSCCACKTCTCNQTEEFVDIQIENKERTEIDDNQFQQEQVKKHIKGHHMSTNKLKNEETLPRDENISRSGNISADYAVNDSITPYEVAQRKEQKRLTNQVGEDDKSADIQVALQSSVPEKSSEQDKQRSYQENFLAPQHKKQKVQTKSPQKESKQEKMGDSSENDDEKKFQPSSDENYQNAGKLKKDKQLQEKKTLDEKFSEQSSGFINNENKEVAIENSNTPSYNQKDKKVKQKEKAGETVKSKGVVNNEIEDISIENSNTQSYNQKDIKDKQKEKAEETVKLGTKTTERTKTHSSNEKEEVTGLKKNTEDYTQKEENTKQKKGILETENLDRDNEKGIKSPNLNENVKGTIRKSDTENYSQDEGKASHFVTKQAPDNVGRDTKKSESPNLNENMKETSRKSNTENYSQEEGKADHFVQKQVPDNLGRKTQESESPNMHAMKEEKIFSKSSTQDDTQNDRKLETNSLSQNVENEDKNIPGADNRDTSGEREEDSIETQNNINNLHDKQYENTVGNQRVDESKDDAERKDDNAYKTNVESYENKQVKKSTGEEFQSENDSPNLKKPVQLSGVVSPKDPVITTPKLSVPPLSTDVGPQAAVEALEGEKELAVEGLISKVNQYELVSKPQMNKTRKSVASSSSANKSKQQKKFKKVNSFKPAGLQQDNLTDEFNEYDASTSESLEDAIPRGVTLSDDEGEQQKELFDQNPEDATDLEEWDPIDSMRYDDICGCVPGYCTCGKQHYVFKGPKQSKDLHIRTTTPTGIYSKQQYDPKESFSVESSCSCIHGSFFDDIDVNPKLSRIEVVALPPETTKREKEPEPSCKPPKYQRTLLIIKPEAVQFKDVILRAIKKKCLDIIDERFIQLTPEQVAEIYTENFGSSYFALFVQQMSSSPILVLSIGGFNSLERWSEAIGNEKKIPASWFYPPSVKRRFSIHKDVYDAMRLSDDFERAKIEIRYFFPLSIIDPIIVNSFEVQDYCNKFIHPTLLRGLYELAKYRPSDPVIYLAEWLLINNPNQPHFEQKQVALAPT